jgi:hypothetical protein
MEITINRNSALPVDEEVRRANSRARDRMDRWRRQYGDISQAIRLHKLDARSGGAFPSSSQLAGLRAMRAHARGMMDQRQGLKNELRRTAYAYVLMDGGS